MKILNVDLSKKEIGLFTIPEELEKKFFGGRGINAKLLFDNTGGLENPLSPSYPILFGTGPLTGKVFPMGGRFVATSKSPLTGTIFVSSSGGRAGVMMKKMGVDGILIKGKSASPSYLLLHEGEIEIKEATDLWGRRKIEIKRLLRERYGKDISIMLIGRAGERGVLYANIENDGRFFGRGGLGAIFGAKNLKAIVFKTKRKAQKDPRLNFLKYEWEKLLSANPITSKGLFLFGTGILLNFMRETGLLTTKNFREPADPASFYISGEELTRRFLRKRRACLFCPSACGRITEFGEGPEYETLWSLGANLLIHDLGKVCELNSLCNEYGLDTITMGNTLSYAIELSEKGKWDIGTEYGDFEGIKKLIELTAKREGIGEILSLGTKRMGEIFQDEDAPEVKGLELPAYDPRGAYGQALSFATSNRGGCHLQGYLIAPEVLAIPKLIDRFSKEGKGSLVSLYQNLSAFLDTLILCRFSLFAIPDEYYGRLASALTGERLTIEDILKIGERIWNIERLFNLREGIGPDRLPERFSSVPLNEMIKEYYEARGWDGRGIPRDEKLRELGLIDGG